MFFVSYSGYVCSVCITEAWLVLCVFQRLRLFCVSYRDCVCSVYYRGCVCSVCLIEAVFVLCVLQRLCLFCVFQRLWPSLNYGFSQVLGDRYDSATADAWRRVYNYISMQMKRGMENPDIEPSDDAMGS